MSELQATDVQDRAAESAKDGGGSARETISDLAASTADSAAEVVDVAREQAQSVLNEANEQARKAFDATSAELQQQAVERLERLADSARETSDQLRALAEGRVADAGPMAGVARDLSDRLGAAATRMDDLGPEGVVREMSAFARRRPLVFLAAAGTAGFVVTRLFRSSASSTSQPVGTPGPRISTPGLPATPGIPAQASGAAAFGPGTYSGSRLMPNGGSESEATAPPMVDVTDPAPRGEMR